jgi:hypothetical protein
MNYLAKWFPLNMDNKRSSQVYPFPKIKPFYLTPLKANPFPSPTRSTFPPTELLTLQVDPELFASITNLDLEQVYQALQWDSWKETLWPWRKPKPNHPSELFQEKANHPLGIYLVGILVLVSGIGHWIPAHIWLSLLPYGVLGGLTLNLVLTLKRITTYSYVETTARDLFKTIRGFNTTVFYLDQYNSAGLMDNTTRQEIQSLLNRDREHLIKALKLYSLRIQKEGYSLLEPYICTESPTSSISQLKLPNADEDIRNLINNLLLQRQVDQAIDD